MLQSESQPRESMERILRRINEISTLPHVICRVTQAANDPESSATDLKHIVETDAALSARVLKCVNSAAYGLRNRINSLTHAISYLGFKQVVNLAISAAVCEVFQGESQFGPYNRIQLWRHVVSVAVVARMIAIRQKMQNFEEAFLAGLLHDIGIVLEDQYMHDEFKQMMSDLPADQSLCASERAALGFDHTQLGARVAEAWKLPEVVRHTIKHHHSLKSGYGGEHGNILASVELANVLCTLKGHSSIGVKLVELSPLVLQHLALDGDDIRVLAEDMGRELSLHEELFNLVEP